MKIINHFLPKALTSIIFFVLIGVIEIGQGWSADSKPTADTVNYKNNASMPLQKMKKNNESYVGSLTGKFEVTSTGQAKYSIPVEVLPGTAKLEPALSITYDSTNSNTHNGLLGMGFTLEGITSVTRCPSNKAQNGEIHGVDFTDRDRYCLNGEQLVAVKGTYGADQTEYRTYHDSGLKIVSYGQQGNGPAYFKVWTKEGEISEYGVTDDSRDRAYIKKPDETAVDNNTVAVWGLNKVQDTAGNFESIKYAKNEEAGTFYPVEIDYTGNQKIGTKPYNAVKLIFQHRPDVREIYHAGSKQSLSDLLQKVQLVQGIGAGTKLAYEYNLRYEISPNTSRSRLAGIQKCDSRGICMPETKFQWQTNDAGWEPAPNYIPPAEIVSSEGWQYSGKDSGVRFIDLMGNGLEGIVQYSGWANGKNGVKKGAWINTGSGWQSAPQFTPPDEITSSEGWQYSGKDDGVRFIDLTGNGVVGMVQYSGWSTGIKKGAWLNVGSGWQSAPPFTPPNEITSSEGWQYSGKDDGARFLDLTGSGLTDMILYSGWSHGVKRGAWLNTGSGWQATPQYAPPDEIVSSEGWQHGGEDDGVRFVSLIGSGLPDMVQSSGWSSGLSNSIKKGAWINTGSGWQPAPQFIPPAEIVSSEGWQHSGEDDGVRFIDLTGSGLSDMVQYAGWSSGIKKGAWINTGTGWKSAPQFTPPCEVVSSEGWQHSGEDGGVRFVNLIGSGLLDMVQSSGWSSGTKNGIKMGAWVNTGSGWKSIPQYTPPTEIVSSEGWQHSGKDDGVRFVDLTGSGLSDIVQYAGWSNGVNKGAWLNKAKKYPDYLIGVTNGLGEQLAIDYESLSNPKIDLYTKEHNASYPLMDWQGPMYVVYQTRSDAAVNDLVTLNKLTQRNEPNQHVTTYHYTGAKFDHRGYGFLGFHRVKAKDESTGIESTTAYGQDAPNQTVNRALSIEVRTREGLLIDSTQNTWSYKTFGDGQVNHTYYLAYLAKSIKNNYSLEGIPLSLTVLDTVIDDYGNVIKLMESVKDLTTEEQYTTTTENTYQNNPSTWVIGELIQSRVTTTAPDQSPVTRTSSFEYEPGIELLNKTRVEPDDANFTLTKTFKRDSYGNIIATTTSGKDIESRTTTVQYDPVGRSVIQQVDALGAITTFTNDDCFGLPLVVTDANHLITRYQYDGFGRLLQKTTPDHVTTTEDWQWTHGTPLSSVYSKVINTTGRPTVTHYYDSLNREVAVSTIGFDGRLIWETTQYDELDRPVQKSMPYYGNEKPYYTRLYYDILGRVIKIVKANGDAVDIHYDGFATTTINPMGQKAVKITDVRNNLRETIDNLGHHTLFQYDPFGNLIKTIDSQGNTAITNYDKLGRKIALNDPDQGQWHYRYDVLGELLSQTDSRGNTVSFTYDKQGKMLTRIDPAGTSAWEYGISASEHNVEQLVRIVGVANRANGVALIQAEKNGLINYEKRFNYDDYGRLSKNQYVINNGKPYEMTVSYDTYGRTFEMTYPSGKRTQNRYNDFGYLRTVIDAQNGKVYQQIDAMDASGHITCEENGAGYITIRTYDLVQGFLLNTVTKPNASLALQQELLNGSSSDHKKRDEAKLNNASDIQSLYYQYDALGNVKERHDAVTQRDDTYQYDRLNRLMTWSQNGVIQESYDYDDIGNLTYKSDRGYYHYDRTDGAGPHAVTRIEDGQGRKQILWKYRYDASGNQVEADQEEKTYRTISYASFNKPLVIQQNDQRTTFFYNAERERFIRVDEKTGEKTTTLYLDKASEIVMHESNGKMIVMEKDYLTSDTIFNFEVDSSKQQIYYLLRDALGSVTTISNDQGTIMEQYRYKPFGDQQIIKGEKQNPPVTHQGFTGHEEVETMNLVHMNGRIYDPLLGRFLSADPFIQDPGNSQSLNRYSYCLNNPMAFTDPTGYWSWGNFFKSIRDAFSSPISRIVVGAFIGIGLNIIMPGLGMAYWTSNSWWMGAVIGGMVTTGIGLSSGVGAGQAILEGIGAMAFVGGAYGLQQMGASSAAIEGSGLAAAGTSGRGKESSGGTLPGGGAQSTEGSHYSDQTEYQVTIRVKHYHSLNEDGMLSQSVTDKSSKANLARGSSTQAFARLFLNWAKEHAADIGQLAWGLGEIIGGIPGDETGLGEVLQVDGARRIEASFVKMVAKEANEGIESVASRIAKGHAFEKHVMERNEFSGIKTVEDFAGHIKEVMSNPSEVRALSNGRTGYWHEPSGTVVIRNPGRMDAGTAFKPWRGKGYFDELQ